MKCSFNDCFNCQYEDCKNDYVKINKSSTKQQNKKIYERRKLIRQERFDNGFCVNCGKNKPVKGYKMCVECQAYFRRKSEEKNRKNGILPRSLLNGVSRCSKCGKCKPVDGYKLCERCLTNARKFLDKTPTHNNKKQIGGVTDENHAFWSNKKQKEGK